MARELFKFTGPFQVARQKCDNTYLVEDLLAKRKKRTWRRFNAHVAQMRLFHVRSDFDWRPEDDDGPLEDECTDSPVEHEVPELPTNGPHDDAEQTTRENDPEGTSIYPPGRSVRRPKRFRDFVVCP